MLPYVHKINFMLYMFNQCHIIKICLQGYKAVTLFYKISGGSDLKYGGHPQHSFCRVVFLPTGLSNDRKLR